MPTRQTTVLVLADPAGDTAWARVTEDDRAIKIETDELEAVIPQKNPKQWMTDFVIIRSSGPGPWV